MPKPTGPTDANTQKLIRQLERKKEYAYLARQLSRPRRSKRGINLSRLEKTGNGSVAVPGKVLGAGEISKPLVVYARSFSKEARRKIIAAGGECLPLGKVVESREMPRVVA